MAVAWPLLIASLGELQLAEPGRVPAAPHADDVRPTPYTSERGSARPPSLHQLHKHPLLPLLRPSYTPQPPPLPQLLNFKPTFQPHQHQHPPNNTSTCLILDARVSATRPRRRSPPTPRSPLSTRPRSPSLEPTTVPPVPSSLVSPLAASVPPPSLTLFIDSEKSATQKVGDSTRGGADQGKGVLGQAQESLGNAAQAVQDTISGNKK